MIRLVGMAYVALLAGLVFGSYHVSYRTELAATALKQINDEISAERTEVDMLQSEWEVRTAPDYLRKLTDRYLPELRPTLPDQYASLEELPARGPEAGAPPTIEELLKLVELSPDANPAARPKERPSL